MVSVDKSMRHDWDERAKKDALHYIASWEKTWDPDRFFESGETDYRSLVQPTLGKLAFVPAERTMLEVGCGVGRMTRAFSARFGRVFALDISPEMLRKAKALHENATNIFWVQGDGSGLYMIRDESVDFVFSYIVLQHVPTKDLVLRYICEMLRVLKPDGAFQFQFNSRHEPTMNWKGRLAWGLIDRLREPVLGLDLRKASHRLASLLGLDPLAAGHTWRGAVVDVRDVTKIISENRGAVVRVTGEETLMTWCYGKKSG